MFAMLMQSDSFILLKDIFFILFLLLGTLWMWGILKFKPATQEQWEKTFARSRWRFKWLFLAGFILITAAVIYRRFIA